MRRWFVFVFLTCSSAAFSQPLAVDWARVTVEKRSGIEWCVLDSQASGTVGVPLQKVLVVIEDYRSYPALFSKIKEVRVTEVAGAVLLTETVVVSALGIVNTNRFTLRIVRATESPKLVRLTWIQEETDGTIDSLEGGWILEELGSVDKPLVKVTYRTKSAVPTKVPGQDFVIGMFLGGETKGVVESVFKKALSR